MSLYMFLKMPGMSEFTGCTCLWSTSITALVADVKDIHISSGRFIPFLSNKMSQCFEYKTERTLRSTTQ